MSRIRMDLSYDGSAYHGWQIQENARTVQGTVQKALKELFEQEISLSGCSRTDAGVHAKHFVCHFDTSRTFPWEKLPLALNARLPEDIAVFRATPVSPSFHARFSCQGKSYHYRLINCRIRDPFEKDRAAFWPVPLCAQTMHLAAQDFVGEHDFSAFMATGSQVKDTVRTIFSFSVNRSGDCIDFVVSGNGFLYNMVRIMVGTLIYENLGKLDRSISEIIRSCDRTLAGITVPPQGLYLEQVFY